LDIVNSFFFVSDLHGHTDRYQRLFQLMKSEKPPAVFLGGDLLPHRRISGRSAQLFSQSFIDLYLIPEFKNIRKEINYQYPEIFLILGNDDERAEEEKVLEGSRIGLWQYIHFRKVLFRDYPIYGYSFVPPSPFLLKDWEKYDVSRYVDPGCISPEEGFRSVPVDEGEIRTNTIQEDLQKLTAEQRLDSSIFLFHSPPYQTNVDRAALDGRMVDHVPMDVHVGSMAIKRFIEERQPLITLHGHVHESTRLTGTWKEQIGSTWAFNAAHDGPELAVVKFDPEKPAEAIRQLY
jgi:Icc-related predicted phosphoesterase